MRRAWRRWRLARGRGTPVFGVVGGRVTALGPFEDPEHAARAAANLNRWAWLIGLLWRRH